MQATFGLEEQLANYGVDITWWKALLDGGKLAWYPYDDITGFRLDASCAFECPHRHFSHLLQLYDLETVHYDTDPETGTNHLFFVLGVLVLHLMKGGGSTFICRGSPHPSAVLHGGAHGPSVHAC